ncbi:hypothetical protein HYPSUDRAFT_584561 [Hypholoma sublateritium FD-334 SS-4]|uniref:Uncharacterized protein n=1 Tax=Hypholoma sublateritium (strain FD-334 SS-4) TaxID=945553 RepID=A0A0D2P4N8_HYPSF|nr:hypothetical protein HYPSUDRAFT_584561 [Hypholoma sublateritium FD-334 SS-4]
MFLPCSRVPQRGGLTDVHKLESFESNIDCSRGSSSIWRALFAKQCRRGYRIDIDLKR